MSVEFAGIPVRERADAVNDHQITGLRLRACAELRELEDEPGVGRDRLPDFRAGLSQRRPGHAKNEESSEQASGHGRIVAHRACSAMSSACTLADTARTTGAPRPGPNTCPSSRRTP